MYPSNIKLSYKYLIDKIETTNLDSIRVSSFTASTREGNLLRLTDSDLNNEWVSEESTNQWLMISLTNNILVFSVEIISISDAGRLMHVLCFSSL